MPIAEYEYPDPSPDQVLAHLVLAEKIMGWIRSDTEPKMNEIGNHAVYFDTVRRRCYHGHPFPIEDIGLPQTWFDYAFSQWSPATDPRASQMLRLRLQELGWSWGFTQHGPVQYTCRLSYGGAALIAPVYSVYAAGESLEESIVWAALEAVTYLKTERAEHETSHYRADGY